MAKKRAAKAAGTRQAGDTATTLIRMPVDWLDRLRAISAADGVNRPAAEYVRMVLEPILDGRVEVLFAPDDVRGYRIATGPGKIARQVPVPYRSEAPVKLSRPRKPGET